MRTVGTVRESLFEKEQPKKTHRSHCSVTAGPVYSLARAPAAARNRSRGQSFDEDTGTVWSFILQMPDSNDRAPQFEDDPLTGSIIGAAIEVHSFLGPGLLESAYRDCLCYELAELNLEVEIEPFLPITYKRLHLARVFRPDLIVERAVIVELKSVEKILQVHEAQALTYLRLSGLTRGLVLNFNVVLMKHGIRRLNLSNPSPRSPFSPITNRPGS